MDEVSEVCCETNSKLQVGMKCVPVTGIREFTGAEIETDTCGFQQLVGTGAFGSVYKGSLQHVDVAVKVLDSLSDSCGSARCRV